MFSWSFSVLIQTIQNGPIHTWRHAAKVESAYVGNKVPSYSSIQNIWPGKPHSLYFKQLLNRPSMIYGLLHRGLWRKLFYLFIYLLSRSSFTQFYTNSNKNLFDFVFGSFFIVWHQTITNFKGQQIQFLRFSIIITL